jgi:hypothetical protein
VSMNLDEAVKRLYDIRDQREKEFRMVTRAAEGTPSLAEYQERLRFEVEAVNLAIIFLKEERDKANAKQKS